MDKKMMDWLKKEAEQWVEAGIISPEQCNQIQMQYTLGRTGNLLLTIFAIIGSLLIGSGIILVFATNWWNLPVEVRIALAFTPLLIGQGICFYIYKRHYDSVAFREGGAAFLCLSFFAAVALIGQIFHLSSSLDSYIKVCILFSLPSAYLFRSKVAMTIYVAGIWSVNWFLNTPGFIFFAALALPYFFFGIKTISREKGVNYLLFLFSTITLCAGSRIFYLDLTLLERSLVCGMLLLLVDAAFRRIQTDYFFTVPKFLGIASITIIMLVAGFDWSFTTDLTAEGYAIIGLLVAGYVLLRHSAYTGLVVGDLLATASFLLVLASEFAGIMACMLVLGIGIYYIIVGCRTLALNKLNYGMAMATWMVLNRFYDSELSLLGKGIVFILAGIVFLFINLVISRKRKERSL